MDHVSDLNPVTSTTTTTTSTSSSSSIVEGCERELEDHCREDIPNGSTTNGSLPFAVDQPIPLPRPNHKSLQKKEETNEHLNSHASKATEKEEKESAKNSAIKYPVIEIVNSSVLSLPLSSSSSSSHQLNCTEASSAMTTSISNSNNSSSSSSNNNSSSNSSSSNNMNDLAFISRSINSERNDIIVTPTLSAQSEPSSISTSNSNSDKAQVILLGRGNSFSLGRSEVILLHKRPNVKKRRNHRTNSNTTDTNNLNNNNSNTTTHSNKQHLGLSESGQSEQGAILDTISELQSGNNPSSPPPISDGNFIGTTTTTIPHTNGWHRPDEGNDYSNNKNAMNDGGSNHGNDSDGDDCDDISSTGSSDLSATLEDLWAKAEEVMFARQSHVMKVLEDFGIGEQGGGGGGDEGGIEDEEAVWRFLEEGQRIHR